MIFKGSWAQVLLVLGFLFQSAVAYPGPSEWWVLKPTQGPITIKTKQEEWASFLPFKREGRSYYQLTIPDPVKPRQIYLFNKKFTPSGYEICEHFRTEDEAQEPNQKPDYYILHLGGVRKRAEIGMDREIFDKLPKKRFRVWALNYPGFGESEGNASLKLLVPAALEAFDLLRIQANGVPILLSGQSIGTAVALALARQRAEVAGLILLNPGSFEGMVQSSWFLWTVSNCWDSRILRELNSVENAEQIPVPAVFLKSLKNQAVPVEFQIKIFNSYAGKKEIVVFDRDDDEERNVGQIIQEKLRWLVETIRS